MLSEMLEKEVKRLMGEFMISRVDATQMAKSKLFDKLIRAAVEDDRIKVIFEEILL